MARSVTVSGDRIRNTSIPAPSSTGTVSIWLNTIWNSGDSNIHPFWGNSGVANIAGDGDRPSFQKFSDNNIYAGFTGGGGGDQRIVIADTGLFTSGTWAHWAFTWSNAAGQTLYKDAISKGTHALTFPTVAASASAGNYDDNNATTQAASANVAEFARWTVILDAGEIGALAKGYSPLLIRPSALEFYWPLLRNLVDPISAFDGTATGTTVAVHPRIIMSSSGKARRLKSVAVAPLRAQIWM